MAKGNKNPSITSRFKKGQTGNPNGRPKMDPAVNQIRKLAAEEYAEIVCTMLYSTDAQIAQVLNDPSAWRLKKVVASILDKALETGSPGYLEFLLARVLGKVKETIEHKVESRSGASVLEEFRQMLNDSKNERQD